MTAKPTAQILFMELMMMMKRQQRTTHLLLLPIFFLMFGSLFALVTCDNGCNDSVVAIRFQTLDPEGGTASMCRVYDVTSSAMLDRAVRVEGNALEDDEPVVEVTYWHCRDLKVCAAMCNNEATGIPGGSQRNQTEEEPDETCTELQHKQRHCINSSGS